MDFGPPRRPISRRELLGRCGMGMGALGLTTLLQQVSTLGAVAPAPAISGYTSPLAARPPQFAARAKRVLHIFTEGGASHVDTFDPKPALNRLNGKPIKLALPEFEKNAPKAATDMGRLSGNLYGSPFKFQKYGQCGMEVSELFPNLARHADNLCVVRSMQTKSSVHEIAQLIMNCGDGAAARPSMGSWVTYGLGAENQNLPAFIALTPGAFAAGDKHWSNSFLPGYCGGTSIRTGEPSVDKMIEHVRSTFASNAQQRKQLDLLYDMNRRHLERRGHEDFLESRISSFETAYRMQAEATDAFDLSREPESVRKMYGDGPQGRQLLLARRLLERGVRVVQSWHTGWDTHDENDEKHRILAKECDQPLAALLTDLKQRGMLDDTLVIWGGEFGRTPTTDNNDVAKKKSIGRDHNAAGYTIWMAGGGTKGGLVHGTTDDLGAVAVDGAMDVHDLHATVLRLLGFDHTRLTYRYAGRDFRLTDVSGNVMNQLLA